MKGNKREKIVVLFWILIVLNVLWFGSRMFHYTEKDEDSTDYDKASMEYIEVQESVFYYNQLPGEEKKVYDSIKAGMLARSNSFIVENCDEDALVRVWDAVLMDCPEIFWVGDYRYRVLDNDTKKCEILPIYIYTKNEIKEKQNQIELFVKKFVSGISKDESDYKKILYTYETIIKSTEYSLGAANNQHIDSVILGKSSVCAGYAKTTKYLLNLIGVECSYVKGSADNGEGAELHAWNIVTCEGEHYFVDATWGDPVYKSVDTKSEKEYHEVNYDYMCCNEEWLFRTHELGAGYSYPSCTSLNCSYYVMEGRYLTKYDENAIRTIIEQDIENKSKSSVFKFSDSSAYEETRDPLINVHLHEGTEIYSKKYDIDKMECYYVEDKENLKITLLWE